MTNRYHLSKPQDYQLNDDEIFAICKILLSSRTLAKEEIEIILTKLIRNCEKNSEKTIKALIGNEMVHYVEPKHQTACIHTMWHIGNAINECR